MTKVDTADVLGETAGKVAAVLKRLDGGIHGSVGVSWKFDDFHRPAYKVQVKGPGLGMKRRPGLYDPGAREGGFLGLFSRPRRLSVLEATDRVMGNKPVQIRDGRGIVNTVSSVNDLASFLKLR